MREVIVTAVFSEAHAGLVNRRATLVATGQSSHDWTPTVLELSGEPISVKCKYRFITPERRLELTCSYCSSPFTSPWKHQVYCSDACRKRSNALRARVRRQGCESY